MDYRISVLERAFQLASSGECSSVPEIRKHLKEEGRPGDQIIGRMLLKQLRGLIEAAQGKEQIPRGAQENADARDRLKREPSE